MSVLIAEIDDDRMMTFSVFYFQYFQITLQSLNNAEVAQW